MTKLQNNVRCVWDRSVVESYVMRLLCVCMHVVVYTENYGNLKLYSFILQEANVRKFSFVKQSLSTYLSP